jgi:hypothetical protein
MVCRTLACESWSWYRNSNDWANDRLLKEIKYDLCDKHNADETGCFNIQPSNSVTFCGNPCHGGTKSKQQVTVLLVCNANGSDTLPPIVLGKYQACSNNSRILYKFLGSPANYSVLSPSN